MSKFSRKPASQFGHARKRPHSSCFLSRFLQQGYVDTVERSSVAAEEKTVYRDSLQLVDHHQEKERGEID